MPWTVVYADESGFARFLKKLDLTQRTCVEIGIYEHLAVYGLDLLSIGKVKHIRGELYEYKLGPISSQVARYSDAQVIHQKLQLRIFIAFRAEQMIVVASGYDKGRYPSRKKQQDEIARAFKILASY